MFAGWFITAGMIGGLLAAEADDVPITFTRGGRAATVSIMAKQHPPRVVLRTFERCWTEPTAVLESASTIQVPEVERPVVFSVTPVDEEHREIGQVVAYPGPTIRWERNPVLIHTIDPPAWFRQWAEATDTQLHPTDRRQLHRRKRPVKSEESELLVLGQKAAGDEPADVFKLADEANLNVLVLEAAWFGTAQRANITLTPANMDGPLGPLQTQQWHKPPRFTRCNEAWPGLTNRRAWVRFDDLPMVEQVGPLQTEHRIILSYLPWLRQLGRNDVADNLLEAVIRATADPKCEPITLRRISLLHPRQLDVDDDKTAKERPVLTAAIKHGTPVMGHDLAVIDVRGPDAPPYALLQTLKTREAAFDESHPLLILGDDPLLEQWLWLSRQNSKPRSEPSGVIWLKDDTLGPDTAEQIRLMLALSQNGVPLKELAKEK